MSNFTRRDITSMIAARFATSGISVLPSVASALAQGEPGLLVSASAAPVVRFLESMGICIHHAQNVRLSSYFEPLRYLGVRNVRDDYGPPASYVTLYKSLGVRSVLIAQGKPLDEAIAGYRKLAEEGALLAVEGPNEPNNFPISYEGKKGGGFNRILGGADWTPVARYQRDLYARVKAEQSLKDVSVFNVSEVGAQSPDVGLQFLEIPPSSSSAMPIGTRYADYLNVHNYVSSTQRKRYVDNQAWQAADPLLNSIWDGVWGNHVVTWGHNYAGYSPQTIGSIPRVTTETGWDSNGVGGERVQGIVLLNTYLSQFKRGWAYTFVYMLRDGEGGSGNQGVFNKDSSPKLAAKYIHNFTNILEDIESQTSPGKLSYFIQDATEFVHHLLLQKSNGDFYLVVWCEKVSGLTNVEIIIDVKNRSGDLFDPTVSPDPIEKIGDVSRFKLELSDHCVIIRIPGS